MNKVTVKFKALLATILFVGFQAAVYAEDLSEGWHMLGPTTADPSQQLAQGFVTQSLVQGASVAAPFEITPEIQELARGLQYDPKLIYEYVRNHVEYVPYYGALKGAFGTLIDGIGNDFDQAALMVALLKASGYSSAAMQYGAMDIPEAEIMSWLKVEDPSLVVPALNSSVMLYNYSSNGAYPVVGLERVWVSVTIDGVNYKFDPALKSYEKSASIDMVSAMNFNLNDLMGSVLNGASVGSDYVQNFNDGALRNKLTELTSNFINTIKTQYPNKSVEEVLGGYKIIPEEVESFETELPYVTDIREIWYTEVPAERVATLRIQHEGIDHTFAIPQIMGKRLTVIYVGGDNRPELRLEGVTIATGNPTTLGQKYDLIATINHPYHGDNGTYLDKTVTFDQKSGGVYAIVGMFSGISLKNIERRRKILTSYLEDGLSESSESVQGETLNIMGLSWMKDKSFS